MSLASWLRNLFSSSPRPQGPQAPLRRNDVCWCGSGKKYKKCHLKKDELNRVEAALSAQTTARNLMASGVMPGGSGKKKPARQPEAAARPAERG
ncbi:MAG: SEC-C metal-binding domain-containing protein [Thermoanaerobaculia bacterium]